ncbi:MAG TPA: hypothetical protein VGP95_15195 [Gemmatimonadaceae bacterium]|nr:hypothetical protein [Gemmatimonadaceae bacterium]
MRPITPRRIHLAVLGLAAMTAGCSSDSGTAPALSAPHTPRLALAAFDVMTVQLRALPPNPVLPPNPIFGYGHLQIRLGSSLDDSCLPPNPISPQPGFTLVSVCGRIFNEGGALYKGGAIYLTGGLGDSFNLPVAFFNGAVPNDPCRRYDIAGAIEVPDAVASNMVAHTTSYSVLFDGDVGGSATRIGGLLDGSAWGPVGERPETDPYFAEKICTVAVTP